MTNLSLISHQEINEKELLINMSFLMIRPTGTSNYALNILPYISKINSIYLSPRLVCSSSHYQTPYGMTSEYGAKGHLRRLFWTQFQLSAIYKSMRSKLLFSPIPEAPLFTDCRFIVTAHDFIPLRFFDFPLPLTLYNKYYVHQVLEQSLHVTCNSLSTAKDLVDFCNISHKKVTVIPHAYDNNNFRLLDIPISNYFLYIGRQDTYKNLRRIVSAFRKMSNHKDYELWLVGPTDKRYTPALKKQVQELGIADQVKFLDYVPYDDLPKIISGAIALVFPSLWEGFGVPVLEAMACGTPVITSNLSSLPEVAGDAAILIDPYRVEEITDAMQAIANDTRLRSHLSQLGLQRAKQFSWEKTGQATVEVLQRFL
jgi:glycosyltransferase involved in cell wall biosynthesis